MRFDYPANWVIGRQIHAGAASVIPLRVPRSPAEVRLSVSPTRVSFDRFPTGRRVKTSAGTVSYHRVFVAGRPAVEVEVETHARLTHMSTEVNAGSSGYALSVTTTKPPLESRTIDGYQQIVRSLRID